MRNDGKNKTPVSYATYSMLERTLNNDAPSGLVGGPEAVNDARATNGASCQHLPATVTLAKSSSKSSDANKISSSCFRLAGCRRRFSDTASTFSPKLSAARSSRRN